MKNETILVVEDEPAIQEMIVTTLEMAGFDCLQASDVSQAVSYTHLTLPTICSV